LQELVLPHHLQLNILLLLVAVQAVATIMAVVAARAGIETRLAAN
jgi:hypothetical protein